MLDCSTNLPTFLLPISKHLLEFDPNQSMAVLWQHCYLSLQVFQQKFEMQQNLLKYFYQIIPVQKSPKSFYYFVF